MKRWIKYTLTGVLPAAFLLALAFGALYYLFSPFGMCANEVFAQENSPDGKYKALVFQRDCGATTGFSTQVSVLKMQEELGDEGGNSFIVDGHPNETHIELLWADSSNLTIKNTTHLETYRKESRVQSISINYE